MLVQHSLLPTVPPKIHEAGQIKRPDHFAIVKRLIAETGHKPISPKDRDTLVSLDHVLRAGGCHRPVRLTGKGRRVNGETGEVLGPWSTDSLPGGVAYVACKTRRASKCSVCAWLYQGDAYQLIVAGLRGGKDTTEAVSEHPALFVTLTAPSFGKVHTRRKQGKTVHPCHSGQTRRCKHGNELTCNIRHDKDDRALGQPLCMRCHDYETAVLWNAHASELWRRTRIQIDRLLAQHLEIPRSKLKDHLRVEYVKVAEFQRRGAVHFHIVMRVNGPTNEEHSPIDEETLTAAIDHAASRVKVKMPNGRRARWGTQRKVIPVVVDPDESDEQPDEINDTENRKTITRGQAAGYLGKYSTKSADGEAMLDSRIRSEAQLMRLQVSRHFAKLITTAWNLGERYPELRTMAWAHQFGYRGHFMTKSKHWSTTFSALRDARKDHVTETRKQSWQNLSDDTLSKIVARWTYKGSGYATTADAWIADVLQRKKHDERQKVAA